MGKGFLELTCKFDGFFTVYGGRQEESWIYLSMRRPKICRPLRDIISHKVLTYVEYRAVSRVFQKIDPPPPSPPSECVLPPPRTKGGGYTIAGR
jgi:hypothetical protein